MPSSVPGKGDRYKNIARHSAMCPGKYRVVPYEWYSAPMTLTEAVKCTKAAVAMESQLSHSEMRLAFVITFVRRGDDHRAITRVMAQWPLPLSNKSNDEGQTHC